MKNELKIMKQQLRAVLQKQPLSISRVGLISSKAAGCMPFWWKWVPSWVFLKYFAYFVISCVNGCFRVTALTGSIIILSSLFILILHGRKVFWRALSAFGFLINIWYCISCLLKINSMLEI